MYKQPNSNKRPKNTETFRALAYFSHIGVTMAACVLVGVLLGKFLDGLLGSSHWLVLIFSLLGVGAAIKSMFKMSKDKR